MTTGDALANWNGELMPLRDVRVSVLDRAFLFGDAIYEVLRVYRGRPFLEAEHLERLRRSLREIRVSCDVDRLVHRMRETLRLAQVQEGLIYIQVTRGEAPRTHRFPQGDCRPNELVYVEEFTADPYAVPREAGAATVTIPDLRWKRCDIKSVNLLANCLAAQQAAEQGCVEALLVAADGTITEGSHMSAFGVMDGQVLTSPLSPSILPGITRGLLARLAARCDVPLQETSFRVTDLPQLDELFLTGTTSEVLPVVQVDGQAIGTGRPGPVTRALQAAYRQFLEEQNW
ncbi:MAG: D-amino acid aminotransferase [Planctomycetaceae bacterium]|nr:D-amino acid aminotransferase [Planctomycetaceae bacterium]